MRGEGKGQGKGKKIISKNKVGPRVLQKKRIRWKDTGGRRGEKRKVRPREIFRLGWGKKEN